MKSWLLADREVVQRVLGREGAYHFSVDPEERPHCDTLKDHIREQAGKLHRADYEIRNSLAFHARPDRLKDRCQRCYPPFLADIEKELRHRFRLPERSPGKSIRRTRRKPEA